MLRVSNKYEFDYTREVPVYYSYTSGTVHADAVKWLPSKVLLGGLMCVTLRP